MELHRLCQVSVPVTKFFASENPLVELSIVFVLTVPKPPNEVGAESTPQQEHCHMCVLEILNLRLWLRVVNTGHPLSAAVVPIPN
jgi:hypothetical protein